MIGPETGPIWRGKTIDELAASQITGDLPATLLQRYRDTLQAEYNRASARVPAS